jgi:hypothetical protein
MAQEKDVRQRKDSEQKKPLLKKGQREGLRHGRREQ